MRNLHKLGWQLGAFSGVDGPILSAVAGYKGPGGGLLQSLCCRMKLVVSVPSYPVELETKVHTKVRNHGEGLY